MLRTLTLSPLTKRTPFICGRPRIETLPFSLTWATLPSPKVTFGPLKSSKKVKKDLSLVICLEQPLSKYYSLGALARFVNITLHLDISFLNHTCFTLGGDLEDLF